MVRAATSNQIEQAEPSSCTIATRSPSDPHTTPPAAAQPLRAEPNRPFLIKYGKPMRAVCDRLIAACSLISTDPVLDSRDFPWTTILRNHWTAIRDEAIVAALDTPAPSLATISPDHRSIAAVDQWRSFFLWGYGYLIEQNLERCSKTAEILSQIPGLNTAFFSILAPGTRIPPHRGVTKGLITCHLGLIVPHDGDVSMRVDNQIIRWHEGETLVFDDSYDHEVWNDSTETRVVLLVQFRRPLRQPGTWFLDTFLAWIRGSAFVQEALANLNSWNAAVKALEK